MPMAALHCLLVTASAAVLASHARVEAFVAPAALTRATRSAISVERPSDRDTRCVPRLSTPAAASATSTSPEDAKENLKRVLADNGGSTLASDVVIAIEALTDLNPTTEPGRAWPLLSGSWVSIGEDFAGTTRTIDGIECTFGRLIFNAFEPAKLPILITAIGNEIGSPTSAGGDDKPFYSIKTRFVARDGSGMRGKTTIAGYCVSNSSNPQRLQVGFAKVIIEPDDGQDVDAWKSVFHRKDESGAQAPAGDLRSSEGLSLDLTGSPEGWLDVLYLDDEIRVTRGYKGAVVVATRA